MDDIMDVEEQSISVPPEEVTCDLTNIQILVHTTVPDFHASKQTELLSNSEQQEEISGDYYTNLPEESDEIEFLDENILAESIEIGLEKEEEYILGTNNDNTPKKNSRFRKRVISVDEISDTETAAEINEVIVDQNRINLETSEECYERVPIVMDVYEISDDDLTEPSEAEICPDNGTRINYKDNEALESASKSSDDLSEKDSQNYVLENEEEFEMAKTSSGTEAPLIEEDERDRDNESNSPLENEHSVASVIEFQDSPIKQEVMDVLIKEEITDDYELEDFTSYDETLPDELENHTELPPEDIYHFKNRIILGSKPTSVETDKYLAIVIKDLGNNLRQSQRFCQHCQILFPTANRLDYHHLTCHSLLAPIPNRAVKSTAKGHKNATLNKNCARKSTGRKSNIVTNSTYCNHCDVTFKDHTALITHLYDLLPVKKYKCSHCDEEFQTQSKLLSHSYAHVEKEAKILNAKKNLDNPLLRSLLGKGMKRMSDKYTVKVEETISPVEKVEYKCIICDVVVDSYGKARAHRRTHAENRVHGKPIFKKVLWKTTNSPIHFRDKLTFEEDIKASNKNKYKCKVGTIEVIPTSALFQCSKCNTHFLSNVGGTTHVIHSKCGDPDYAKNTWNCPLCKKTFRKADESAHRKQHKFSSKLKIYKITKSTHGRTLCRCLDCGVYFDYVQLKMHVSKCGSISTAKCKRCNIFVECSKINKHNEKHELYNLKPENFILVDYAVLNHKTKLNSVTATLKKIKLEPERSESLNSKFTFKKDKLNLFSCSYCKTVLNSRVGLSIKTHMSRNCMSKAYKKNSSICERCGLSTSRKMRLHHDALHLEKNLTLSDFAFYDFATLDPISPPIPKYPQCKRCKIHFIDINKKRNHICGEDYENCETCGEKFEISALQLHMPFHELQPAKTHATKKARMLPELMLKYQSLNAIWNVLFICDKCNLVTDLYNAAVEHSQAHLNKENIQNNTIKCYICNLKFDESCWSKHSDLHSRMTISCKDFKILKYSPANLLDESWFQMFASLPEKEIRQIVDRSVFGSERSLKMRLIKDGLPEFTVYSCSNCKVSYNSNNILDHLKVKCWTSKHICKKCGIAFQDATTLVYHELQHERGINKEEFRIVYFDRKDNVRKPPNAKGKLKKRKNVKSKIAVVMKKVRKGALKTKFTLFRCQECSVCLHKEINLPYHVCSPEHHLFYCKKCKENFSYKQKRVHFTMHNKQPDFRAKNTQVISFKPIPESDSKPKKKDTMYSTKKRRYNNRLTNLTIRDSITFENETSSQTSTDELANSSSEDDASSKAVSITKRKASIGSSIADVAIEPRNKKLKTANSFKTQTNTEIVQSKPRKSSKVYKCECGLHYTSLKTIKQHQKLCDDHDEIPKEACSKCGLVFPTDVLVSHLCNHHSKDTEIIVEVIQKQIHDKFVETIQDDGTVKDDEGCEDAEDVKDDETVKDAEAVKDDEDSEDVEAVKDDEAIEDGEEAEAVKDNEAVRDAEVVEDVNVVKKVKAVKTVEIVEATSSKPAVVDSIIKLYKCGECNVYFINHKTCYNHIWRHEALDPMQFIECKMCGLQFKIISLHIHMYRHHKREFNLEKVLVEEHQPVAGSAPKIDLYFAASRCQNVQVSSSNEEML